MPKAFNLTRTLKRRRRHLCLLRFLETKASKIFPGRRSVIRNSPERGQQLLTLNWAATKQKWCSKLLTSKHLPLRLKFWSRSLYCQIYRWRAIVNIWAFSFWTKTSKTRRTAPQLRSKRIPTIHTEPLIIRASRLSIQNLNYITVKLTATSRA